MSETDIQKAREAIATLRDFARVGGLDFRQRDPLVVLLHKALDELEAFPAPPLTGSGEASKK